MTPHSFLLPDFSSLLALPGLAEAASVAKSMNARIALVGGAVRDALLGMFDGIDLDISVEGADARKLAAEVARQLDGRLLILDDDFGIYRVVFWPKGNCQLETPEPKTLDFAQAQSGSKQTDPETPVTLEMDLWRRDLTINAMALELTTNNETSALLDAHLIDPCGGLEDLQNKRLRMVSEANLLDDPLRLLRVFRFMAKLPAFKVDTATLISIRRHGAKIWNVAGERIQNEWLKLLGYSGCFPTLQAMADVGFLEHLLPELTPCKPVPPNSHHHLPLFEHTLDLLRHVDEQWPLLPEDVQQHLQKPAGQGASRLAVMRWACLMHDVGKPATWQIEPDGRHRFLGHEKVSEDLCEPVAQRFKLSGEVNALLKKLVRWHLYPCQFGPASSRKSVLRFFRRMGNETYDVTVLALADRLATQGVAFTPESIALSVQHHYWLLETYKAEQSNLQAPPLLQGGEVMALLGLQPSKEVGQWLQRLKEAQQLGEFATADEAKAWLLRQVQTV
jgi:tRNA nucleotidyltransferase/poly(A) polymerase